MINETYKPPSYALAFHHPGVSPGSSVEVDASPSINFVGSVIVFSDPRFVLEDVIVGGRSQFQFTERHLRSMDPAGAFRCVSDTDSRPLDIAKRDSKVVLLVKNTSYVTLAFNGSVLGAESRPAATGT